MSAFFTLLRLIELEAPEWVEERWKKLAYWLAWLATAGLAAALLLATLNGS